MTLWRSGPAPSPQGWLLAALIGWGWSVPVGLVCWLAASAIGAVDSDLALALLGPALFLTFAPVYSWIGLLLALPAAVLAARRGLFGPASAVLIGLLAGAAGARLLGGTSEVLTAPFGAVTLLIVWAVARGMRA